MITVTCLICHTNLKSKDHISVLLCGHVYHNHCITTWFTIKSTCPICREPGKTKYVKKLFLSNIDNESQNEFNDIEADLKCKISALQLEKNCLQSMLNKENKTQENLRRDFTTVLSYNDNLSKELESQKNNCSELQRILVNKQAELENVVNKCKKMEFVQRVTKASTQEIKSQVDQLIQSDNINHKIDTLVTALISNSEETETVKETAKQLRAENSKYLYTNELLQTELKELRDEFVSLQKANLAYNNELMELEVFANRKSSARQSLDKDSTFGDDSLENVEAVLSNVPVPLRFSEEHKEEHSSSNPFLCENKAPRNLIDLSIMNKLKTGDNTLKSLNAVNNLNKKRQLKPNISRKKMADIKSYFHVK